METFMDDMTPVTDAPVEAPAEEVVAETVEHEEAAPAEVEAADVAPEKPKDEPIPKGVQKRIDRAVRQKYEAEARANELERRIREIEQRTAPAAAPKQEGAPKLDQFDNIEDYVEAKARWVARAEMNDTLKAQQAQSAEAKAAAEQKAIADAWSHKAAAAKVEMPDFDEVIESSDVVFTDPAALRAIMESDVGPKIAYYLATNPDEADAITQMTGASAIRAIGRLEAKLEGAQAGGTKAAAPIKPVGQRAKAEKSPNEMTNDEFAKWRKKIIAARGAR